MHLFKYFVLIITYLEISLFFLITQYKHTHPTHNLTRVPLLRWITCKMKRKLLKCQKINQAPYQHPSMWEDAIAKETWSMLAMVMQLWTAQSWMNEIHTSVQSWPNILFWNLILLNQKSMWLSPVIESRHPDELRIKEFYV